MEYKELRNKLTDSKLAYGEKIKLIKSEVETEILRRWSVKCAESVLHVYEKEYPNDSRVRDCINATTQYLDGKIGLDGLKSKRKAAISAAISATNSANSANSAINSANWATNSANSANYAANSAINSAANSDDIKKQQELNIELLLECLIKKIPDTKLGRKLYPNAEITGDKLVIKL